MKIVLCALLLLHGSGWAETVRVFDIDPAASIPGMFVKTEAGERSGLEVQVITEVCRRNNWQIEWVPPQQVGGGDIRLNMVRSGLVQMAIYSITITEERREMVAFSEPYFDAGVGVLVRADAGISELKQLAGKRIHASQGFTPYTALSESELGIVPVHEPGGQPLEQAVAKVLSGTYDGCAEDLHALQALYGQDERLHILAESLRREQFGIAVEPTQAERLVAETERGFAGHAGRGLVRGTETLTDHRLRGLRRYRRRTDIGSDG